MIRRPLLFVIGLGAVASLAAWALGQAADPERAASDGTAARIVSLAPAVTETLFLIGAGSRVVGVSDYCEHPAGVEGLPRLGTGLTPSYERIARLYPTLIVTESNVSTREPELDAIARTVLLPWLTLGEIVSSTRELGRLVGRPEPANQLADRLARRLDVPEPAGGPRVLLVLGYDPGKLDEIWFIRRNSMHGAALHAAGGRNAVPQEIESLPRLSLQRLVELDPDLVIILTPRPVREAVLMSSWRHLHALRAVRDRRVAVLEAPEAFANGPRILELTARLEVEIRRLSGSASSGPRP